MAGAYEFRDYTALKNHKVRMWKMSNSFSLKMFGGIAARVAGVAIAIGIAVGVVVFICLWLVGAPMQAFIALSAAFASGLWFYIRGVSEKAQHDPITGAKGIVRKAIAPRRYTGGTTSETIATHLHWQVILWRPNEATAEIRPIRQFNSYNPQPIGYDERRNDDPGFADILVGYRDPFNPDRFVTFDD